MARKLGRRGCAGLGPRRRDARFEKGVRGVGSQRARVFLLLASLAFCVVSPLLLGRTRLLIAWGSFTLEGVSFIFRQVSFHFWVLLFLCWGLVYLPGGCVYFVGGFRVCFQGFAYM